MGWSPPATLQRTYDGQLTVLQAIPRPAFSWELIAMGTSTMRTTTRSCHVGSCLVTGEDSGGEGYIRLGEHILIDYVME